jgi:SAM-dependent methyltransferase
MTAPPCPICDGGGKPLYRVAEYSMYRCQQCRTAFVSPMPPADKLMDYYTRYHLSNEEGGVYDAADSRMQSSFAAKVELVKNASETATPRLLDVGCGKGFFVKACVDSGLDAEGIDISESGIRYAVEQLKVKATCAVLGDVKDQLGTFDIVTSWATLEHLTDPVGTLRAMSDVLRAGGRLLVMTCSGDDIVERILPGVTQWFDPPQHLVILSRRGMQLALERAGLVLEHLDMNWEYNRARKAARMARNVAVAAGLRCVAKLGRLRPGPFEISRFPLGNDQLAIARKP